MSCLTQAIVDFQGRHPRIEVELLTVDRAVDLVGERIDLAVRITNRLDDGVVARRLASCRSVLCASPAYLKRRGRPQRPEDLKSHDCITHAFGTRAEYRLGQAGRLTTLAVTGPLSGNETAVLRQAALAGAGIAMLPTYFVGDELMRGALVRVLPDHEPEPLGIHAVYLSRQHQPLPLKLLIDFLAERFGGDVAPWDRQAPVSPERRSAGPSAQRHPGAVRRWLASTASMKAHGCARRRRCRAAARRRRLAARGGARRRRVGVDLREGFEEPSGWPAGMRVAACGRAGRPGAAARQALRRLAERREPAGSGSCCQSRAAVLAVDAQAQAIGLADRHLARPQHAARAALRSAAASARCRRARRPGTKVASSALISLRASAPVTKSASW